MAAKRKKRRSRIRNLFFFRRRPQLWGIPHDWERPDDEGFEKLLDSDGFVSIRHWKQDDINQYPIIVQDLRDLDQYLMPTYFEFSQKSRYFQNRFYLFQWVFIWGAFLTTLFGTLSAYTYGTPQGGPVPGIIETTPTPAPDAADTSAGAQDLSWPTIWGYVTAVIGAITAFITALSNRHEPQKRWGKTRRLAEELRMHYFQYLSHIPPYEKEDRVQKLRETVLTVRIKEQENV